MKQRKAIIHAVLAFGALAFVSCADDGFTAEQWNNGVQGQQLASPDVATINVATSVDQDGNDQVVVSWPIVPGAGGYEAIVTDVTYSDAPVVVKTDTVDQATLKFQMEEDIDYTIAVRTLGNARNANIEAATATVKGFSTKVPTTVVPSGEDLATFIPANLNDSPNEQCFALEAGGAYTLSDAADFKHNLVRLLGDERQPATVTVSGDGNIATAYGIKIKNIRFDCTAMDKSNRGIVRGSDKDDDGYGAPAAPKDNCYIVEKTVMIKNCWFKDLKTCVLTAGNTGWSFNDVRMDNCIVQLDNDGNAWSDASIINTYGNSFYKGSQKWAGCVRDLTIKNSTFYNTKSNSKNRVIRYLSNQMSRVYDTEKGSATVENCTFARTFDNKEFANNTPNKADFTVTFNGNICYDTWRLQKFIQDNCSKNVDRSRNTIFGIKNTVDSKDAEKYATEEDPGFKNCDQSLDLTAPNGGVNFHATGAISSTIGDPRWR